MPPLLFALVDVFARKPLTGNPLAVVADADGLEAELMGAIAREFNQSETTFVLASEREDVDWRLRSFTPAGAEVGGAGHNALGAWWWLAAAGRLPLDDGSTPFVQEIGRRTSSVVVSAEGGRPRSVAMDQEPPQFGEYAEDLVELAAALGIDADGLGTDLPAQVISTGAGHLILQARTREVVDAAVPDGARLAAALRSVGGEGCYLYSLDPLDPDCVAYARFFNPIMGIAEDPATGTAAGPLACHLVAQGIAPEGGIAIEQGRLSGRPSRITIRVQGARVTIEAACVVSAEGTLHS